MESFADGGVPNARGPLENKHYEPVSDRAGKLIERFKATKLRHHKDVHADLAEAAECQKLFLENPFEYSKYIDNYFTRYTNKKPKGRETSRDLLNCSYQAVKREDVRTAGSYAMVVDYLVKNANSIGNFEAFLKQHTYIGVLEMAREEKRPGQRSRDERKILRVYMDIPETSANELANPQLDMHFELTCTVAPGRKPKIVATAIRMIETAPLAGSDKTNSQQKRKRPREKSLPTQLKELLGDDGWPIEYDRDGNLV
jgi:hypothetical protein